MHYRKDVTIDAAPQRVWEVLHDVERWPDWSPTIETVQVIEGEAGTVGSKTRVTQPKLRPAVWTIDRSEPRQGFDWSTGGAGWRIVAGHDLQPAEGGGTSAVLTIDLTGPLAGALSLMLGKRTREYVDLEAASLKKASEK
ncbi:MAG: SRPBCC family protein [Mycobacteriales bacterium]